MTTLQKALIAATVLAAVSAAVYETREASQSRHQLLALQQQQAPLVEQMDQSRRQHDDALRKLQSAQQQIDRLSRDTAELPKLRGEVARLREDAKELERVKTAATVNAAAKDSPIEATLKSWAGRATRLKQALEQMPDKSIPELQLLTDKEWLDAVKNAEQLESETDIRQALARLRNSAKQAFADQMKQAFRKYANANNGLLPADLSQLKPYFDVPVDEAMLQRYMLLQSGKLNDVPQNGDAFLFAENAPPVDDEYDSFYQFRMNGTRSNSTSKTGDALKSAAMAYAQSNNGLLPNDPAQLTPYLRQPVDQSKVQDFLRGIPSGASLDQLKKAGW